MLAAASQVYILDFVSLSRKLHQDTNWPINFNSFKICYTEEEVAKCAELSVVRFFLRMFPCYYSPAMFVTLPSLCAVISGDADCATVLRAGLLVV